MSGHLPWRVRTNVIHGLVGYVDESIRIWVVAYLGECELLGEALVHDLVRVHVPGVEDPLAGLDHAQGTAVHALTDQTPTDRHLRVLRR